MRTGFARAAWVGVVLAAGSAAVAADRGGEGRGPAVGEAEAAVRFGAARTGSPAPRPAADPLAWAGDLLDGVRKALVDQLTMPLGTVPVGD